MDQVDIDHETIKHLAALDILKAVADALKELGSVPSGEFYARLCGKFNLQTYTKIIDTLKRAGLIKVEGHLITWVGH